MSEKVKKERELETLTETAIEGAAFEGVQKYGSAVKEHATAYSGVDNEAGTTLAKGLKKIAKSKVSPEYKKTNLKQQAGFVAEEKYRARQNAEKILKGEETRYFRTDDIGRVNDPLYDHIQMDSEGVVLPGSGEQMKFVGNTPKACLDKLKSQKFQKYIDANAKITVPSDYYSEVLAEADAAVEKLDRQVQRAQANGNTEVARQKQSEIDKLKKIKTNLRNSGVSNKEALFARTHPRLSTAIDMGKLGHRAGLDQAKYGAAIGGCLSLITNTVEVIKGRKKVEDAAKDVALSSGKGAALSYATAFSGSIIKGCMQNAGSQTVRALSKTNFASTLITSSIETGKSIHRYMNGEISGAECLEELGEKGTGQLSAAMFAVAGQALIPVPVVGAMIGSMAGYALSSACYKELTEALKEAKQAKEERARIESECAEAIRMISQYRTEMNAYIDQYLDNYAKTFDNAFLMMNDALGRNDIDGFIDANNKLQESLNHKPGFSCASELENPAFVLKL